MFLGPSRRDLLRPRAQRRGQDDDGRASPVCGCTTVVLSTSSASIHGEGRRLHVESGFKVSECLVEERANVRRRVVVEGVHDSYRHSHHSTGEGSQG